MALSIPGMTIVILKIPIFHHILLVGPLAFVTFFFGGIFLAVAFRLRDIFQTLPPLVFPSETPSGGRRFGSRRFGVVAGGSVGFGVAP